MPVRWGSEQVRVAIVTALLSGVTGVVLGLGSGYAALDERIRAVEMKSTRTEAQIEYIKQSVDRIMLRLDVPFPPLPEPLRQD